MDEQIFRFAFDDPAAQRLDKFLVACMPEFSRARLQALIKDGLVLVDGVPARKGGQVLDKGAQVQVTLPPAQPSDIIPEAIPLSIVFENDDLMVVNKPAGMVVHPSIGHASGTLVNAALAHAPDLAGVGGEQRPGIVHRLDRDTSGLILVAKNDRAHRWLQDQFRLRKVKKVYLALVDGRPPTPTGRVEVAIGRSETQRNLMANVLLDKGREAVSEYQTVEAFSQHTLLEVHPLTGRTHQIRLHLQFIGCPVAGDTVYGHKKPTLPLSRHFLHAQRLTIRLPGERQARTFEAPLPAELTGILEMLRLSHPVK
ncbi:MAG: RluA family pseudouridine synthase [Anaerolineales bacterium]|jgi:23S rRNA pseudouridine1911/1915/1917 synthase|nr:RluA family pseudouridine synthase [Anaerolineales bacterium]